MTRHDCLYVFEGCSKHGVKIGVSSSSARNLNWRLHGCRRRCQASKQFAKTWQLDNAYQIEQCVISVLAMSDRNAGKGEEWFHVSLEEMIAAVGFAQELYSPERDRPRRYRMVSGHVWEVDADGNRLEIQSFDGNDQQHASPAQAAKA